MKTSTLSIALIATWSLAAGALSSAQEDERSQDAGEQAEAPEPAASPVRGFPGTAHEYARMVEPVLGVPPRVDLGASVEIPLYVDGVQTYGNLGRKCDNPSFLGKATVSGSTLQRYEGRTADGEPLPDVVWVAFGRNSSSDPERIIASVQMIGYDKVSGATAFFESSDRVGPWVTLDEKTLRMRGVMPWIDDPEAFDRAFVTPGQIQCVGCHQSDPFITNPFINAAKIPGTDEPVVPILDENAPYYVIGGENWDMRTLHIEGNACFDCHRVGMSTVEMFLQNGWHPERYMPPHRPGSLDEDWKQLLAAWRSGPEKVEGAGWVVPPARGEEARVVGDDYPHKAYFNEPGGSFLGSGDTKLGKFGGKSSGSKKGGSGKPMTEEVEALLKQLDDPDVRAAFQAWFEENGVDEETLEKLRSMVGGGKKGKSGKKKPKTSGEKGGA